MMSPTIPDLSKTDFLTNPYFLVYKRYLWLTQNILYYLEVIFMIPGVYSIELYDLETKKIYHNYFL